MSVLCAKQLSYQSGGQQILDNVSVEFPLGQISAVIGPNGAGKTSLMRMLSGELQPHSGTVLFDGQPLNAYTLTHLSRMRSVMTQSSHVVFDFTVLEVLAMGWVGHESITQVDAIEWALDVCHVAELRHRRFNSLSGGEQQRVQFARAMLQICPCFAVACDTPYLLLDEPSASLDVAHEILIFELMRKAANRGVGVVVVMHDLNLAGRFADHIVLLQAGALVAAGSVQAVLQKGRLSNVYATPIKVEWHEALQRLVVFS